MFLIVSSIFFFTVCSSHLFGTVRAAHLTEMSNKWSHRHSSKWNIAIYSRATNDWRLFSLSILPTIMQCRILLKSDLLLSLRLSCGTTVPGIPWRYSKRIAINYTCPTFIMLLKQDFMFIKFSMHAAFISPSLYEISRHLWHLPIDWITHC